MTLILPNGQHHIDMRTPLEKDLGVQLPGVYRPDGTFVPTRTAQKATVKKGVVDALRDAGATVGVCRNGDLNETPPYPPNADRRVRRAVDAHWRKRLEQALSNVREQNTR